MAQRLFRPKLRDLLPNSKKYAPPIEFKIKINTWTTDHCPFRIWKKYFGRVGFISAVTQVLTSGFRIFLLDHLHIICHICVSFSVPYNHLISPSTFLRFDLK